MTTIVEHVLYLGGAGRETSFTSITETEEVAEHFAGTRGAVWKTNVSVMTAHDAKHVPRNDLLQMLRGFGKGRAKWDDSYQVAMAANYVEQWSEHLIDWSACAPEAITALVTKVFKKRA